VRTSEFPDARPWKKRINAMKSLFGKNGKKVWEKIGWKSEGYCARLAAQIRADRRHLI